MMNEHFWKLLLFRDKFVYLYRTSCQKADKDDNSAKIQEKSQN